MYKLAILGSIILLSLFGITGVVRAVANTQTPPPTVHIFLPDTLDNGIENCIAPCWNGINTDSTNHEATVASVMNLPNAQQDGIVEWTFALEDGVIQRVRLERGRDFFLTPDGVRMGDMIAALGTPDFIERGTAFVQSTTTTTRYVRLVYENHHMLVTMLVPYQGRLSPQLPVVQIAYPTRPFADNVERMAWQGYLHLEDFPIGGYGAPLRLE